MSEEDSAETPNPEIPEYRANYKAILNDFDSIDIFLATLNGSISAASEALPQLEPQQLENSVVLSTKAAIKADLLGAIRFNASLVQAITEGYLEAIPKADVIPLREVH